MLRILTFLCALFAAGAANAACNPANRAGAPFNCDAGNQPSLRDLFLGGSLTGNNSGQTVAFTGAQIVGMDHSLAPVTSLASGTGSSAIPNTTKSLAAWTSQIQSLAQTPITIGGQTVYPGGGTVNLGNGPLIPLATGPFTPGHCRQTDSNGNEVDSGGACGGGSGGGGSGSVTSGTTNQLAYYSAAGTAVTGLATANSSVLSTNGTGAPSLSTTLPSFLTIPSPTVSGPVLTGTATYQAATGSGKLTTAASTATAAGLNLPPGTAPTTPANGDLWSTTAGLYARINGATVGPFGTGGAGSGLTAVTASLPLAGAGTSASPMTCATCATTTSGGLLSATAPMSISASGVIAMGTQPGSGVVQWPTAVTVAADTYYYALVWPWASGTITRVSYKTGGTSPSFSIAVQVNGTSVTGCSGLTVNSATITSSVCTAANTVTSGQPVTLVVSGVTGTPVAAAVQISYARSAN